VKFWLVLVLFAKSFWLVFLAGYRRLNRPREPVKPSLGPWVKFLFSQRFSGS
jgi:hypothetical protein